MTPLSTLLSQVLVAHTIELDNEFERRMTEAGGGVRPTSVVMWSNFLRFVRDGIAVGELPEAAGLQKARMQSTLGGMERWRYVAVGSEGRRDGFGSARGLRSEWVVRPTPQGRKAAEIWAGLFREIEAHWEERFGARAVEELGRELRAFVDRVDVELPESLPILGGANGMAADVPPRDRQGRAPKDLHLHALLSQALLAYTLEFERESELSLPLSENFLRVLDEDGVLVRDLPLRAGVPKEAVAMALTALARTPYVSVSGTTAATRRARLTKEGGELRKRLARRHAEVERRLGDTERLRAALERVLDHPDFARGLEPHPDGWRAGKRYLAHTDAMLGDHRAALPHCPMVLHRGGWPDGS
jgi:hypothetical protein